MKKTVLIFIFLGMMQLPALANDFILEFVEENYQESDSAFSHYPIVYHSIQVKTLGGSKLLILTGDNSPYRKWIREYIAENKGFIAVVPDTQTDQFIGSHIFELDISNLHPVNLSKYRRDEMASKPLTPEEWKQLLGDAATQKKLQIPAESVKPAKENPAENLATLAAKEKAALEASTLRQEMANQLKILGEQKAQEELNQLQEMEKERIQSQLAELEIQRAKEEEKRKDEMEQRWQAFQKRMLEDESIRRLEQTERYREMRRRWLEQQ